MTGATEKIIYVPNVYVPFPAPIENRRLRNRAFGNQKPQVIINCHPPAPKPSLSSAPRTLAPWYGNTIGISWITFHQFISGILFS